MRRPSPPRPHRRPNIARRYAIGLLVVYVAFLAGGALHLAAHRHGPPAATDKDTSAAATRCACCCHADQSPRVADVPAERPAAAPAFAHAACSGHCLLCEVLFQLHAPDAAQPPRFVSTTFIGLAPSRDVFTHRAEQVRLADARAPPRLLFVVA